MSNLSFAGHDDEPVTVDGDDRDGERREEDRHGQGRPDHLAEDEGLDSERPILGQDVHKGHRGGEHAQSQVRQRQGRDEYVAGCSHF